MEDRRILQERKTIVELEAERLEWSLINFPEATAFSSLRKLEGEIKEVESDLSANKIDDSIEEYADCLMCLFDSAGRVGILPEQIFDGFAAKLEKNKSRVWKKNADNTYSHVKSEHQVPDIGKMVERPEAVEREAADARTIFGEGYISLFWFKPIKRNLTAHIDCMYDMYYEELKENPDLTIREFADSPQFKEAYEIMGMGLLPVEPDKGNAVEEESLREKIWYAIDAAFTGHADTEKHLAHDLAAGNCERLFNQISDQRIKELEEAKKLLVMVDVLLYKNQEINYSEKIHLDIQEFLSSLNK